MTIFEDGEGEVVVQKGGGVFEITDQAGDDVPSSDLEAWRPRPSLLDQPHWWAVVEQDSVTV
jgi:hypothetical protein